MIVSFKNEGRNHYGRIKKIFETSTRLKSWDSRTSRKGKYLKRTRASLQQANPCRYSPRVADGRSSRHGLSLRFAWLSSSLRTELSRCHRPEACALYLQPKEWFLPPLWSDQHVFWETVVYGIFRQDLPFIWFLPSLLKDTIIVKIPHTQGYVAWNTHWSGYFKPAQTLRLGLPLALWFVHIQARCHLCSHNSTWKSFRVAAASGHLTGTAYGQAVKP